MVGLVDYRRCSGRGVVPAVQFIRFAEAEPGSLDRLFRLFYVASGSLRQLLATVLLACDDGSRCRVNVKQLTCSRFRDAQDYRDAACRSCPSVNCDQTSSLYPTEESHPSRGCP